MFFASMSDTREFVVSAEESGARLDVFLSRHMPDWSRSQVQRQIRSGQVTVGAETVYKAGQAVEAGDRVTLRAARHEMRAVAEDLPVEIVFEDDDLVVVNKPAGMVTHVGSGVQSGTLVNALLHHIGTLSKAGGELRPGIVHRLDRMTSGLVIVAKNDFAHRVLADQFKSRAVHKTYTLLVHGRVANQTGQIKKAVGRDPRRRVRMKVGGIGARDALTRYKVSRRFRTFTLLEAEPHTGRTHQLRVHFSSIGHPIVGDTMYGAPSRLKLAGGENKTLARNFLHARRLEFEHPRSGKTLSFEAPLPGELQEFLNGLESEV
jgi:23S rRNA pseudouridine1911/1915/1917 synthase